MGMCRDLLMTVTHSTTVRCGVLAPPGGEQILVILRSSVTFVCLKYTTHATFPVPRFLLAVSLGFNFCPSNVFLNAPLHAHTHTRSCCEKNRSRVSREVVRSSGAIFDPYVYRGPGGTPLPAIWSKEGLKTRVAVVRGHLVSGISQGMIQVLLTP